MQHCPVIISLMWMKENEFSVKLGGNTFINTPVLISYQGTPLFTVSCNEGGYLAIDFEVYDANRQKIASVKKNNIYPHKDHKSNYALEGTADTLTLIDKDTGKAIVDIKRRTAATEELDVSVSTFLPNGDLLLLGPDSTNIKGTLLKGKIVKNCGVGIFIG